MGMLLSLGMDSKAAQGRQVLMNSSLHKPADIDRETNDPYRSEFFRVNGPPSVTVHTLAGEIEVINNPALTGVQVDLYVEQSYSFWSRSRSLDDYRITIQQRGDQIVASVEDRRSGNRVYDPGNTRFTFLVQIPDENATLNLRSMNGDISVNGFRGAHYIQNHAGDLHLINMSGEVRAASTAGDINILRSEGVLYANSISGSVFVDRAEGEIRLRTVSGDVESRNISGVLVAASTSGNIYTEFRKVKKGIHLETISGNVEVVIPGGSGYEITAQGMGFDFHSLDLSDAKQIIRSGHATVILRDGDIPVNISTLSGKIKVRD